MRGTTPFDDRFDDDAAFGTTALGSPALNHNPFGTPPLGPPSQPPGPGGRPNPTEPEEENEVLIDYDGGEVGQNAPSFEWEGQTFTLDSQPSERVTAAHRVERTPNGEIEIHLEEGASTDVGASAKASYRTDLPDFTRASLGFEYGGDLAESTPTFSNMQGFFRRDPATRDADSPEEAVKAQLLVGSDAGNPNSPFAGSLLRDRNGQETGDFVDNADFPTSGRFNLVTQEDGRVNTGVTVPGSGAATENRDLDPADEIDDFELEQLLLQVETFQDDASFQNQFGDDGQQFTYTDLKILGDGGGAHTAADGAEVLA
ncbi:hypothetical protein SAMN05216241_10692 [Limimonas halophila]|uniref:Uncharacterized protein n=1 Tax=Limimonas halophila TaxID=1082479 RepID=A0A1G7S3N6_9PROT|nr:hypothetical protein [Limimonas halophila]SDG17059.1 hypothetical protein SAMN05216241_10692 [Limimonas halophila]